MSWLIFRSKLVNISFFHIHICIYRFVGLSPNGRRPTHPRKFESKSKNKNCSSKNKTNCSSKNKTNCSSKKRNCSIKKETGSINKRNCYRKTIANAPIPYSLNAFKGKGNCICICICICNNAFSSKKTDFINNRLVKFVY